MKESIIQRDILTWLSLHKWFAFKINNVGIYKKSTNSYIPSQTKGICDIIAIKDGEVIFIECKSKTGKLSEHQKEFQNNIIKLYGHYIIARNIDDIEEYLRNYE